MSSNSSVLKLGSPQFRHTHETVLTMPEGLDGGGLVFTVH